MVQDLDLRIGSNLREIRRNFGLDVDDLARRLGLHPATIALYEAGRLRIPVAVLARLAEVMGRPVDAFFV